MHPSTRRLFASVKSTASKYLEPNTPTGLTGLSTHPHPRPALIYTYKQTLQRLAQLPASSVYRQSTEALTKHRLAVIEAAKPEGYDEWLARVKKQIDDNPAAYARFRTEDGGFRGVVDRAVAEGTAWDGEFKRGVYQAEGPNRMEDAEKKARLWEGEVKMVEEEGVRGEVAKVEDLEREPGLTRDQISEIETKIAGGLIEEVLQVAEGELKVVDEILESRSWEALEEKAPPGQWEYFERGDQV